MAAYIKGNQIKSKQVPWKPQQFNQECSNIKNFFTKELFQSLQPCGSEAMDPIFVVGLPRSGSTLIEQILSSHSLIEGTTELQNIGIYIHLLFIFNTHSFICLPTVTY